MYNLFNKLIIYIFILFFTYNLSYAKDLIINHISKVGIDFAVGFDTLSEEVRKSAVQTPSVQTNQGNQEVSFKISLIPNSRVLAKELGFLNGGSTIFNETQKASFIRENKINDYSLTYLLYVKVKNSSSSLKNPVELSQEAKDILLAKGKKADKIKKFRDLYGDSFIKEIIYGGDFIGLIQISTKSKYDYKNIKDEINFIGLKWNKKDALLKAFKDIAKTHEVNIKNIVLSDLNIIPADNLDELFKNAELFPGKIYNHGIPIEDIITPYTVFDEYKTLYKEDNTTKDTLLNIRKIFLDHLTLKNNLSFIMKNNKEFRFDPVKKKENMVNYNKIADKNDKNSILIELNFKRFKKKEIKAKDILKDIEPIKNYLSDLNIPKRYRAFLISEPLNISEKKVFAVKKRDRKDLNVTFLDKKAPWIALKTLFHIEKQGKIIFLTSDIIAKKDEKTFLKRDNNEILFDTYVDYPGLRFKQIKNKTGELFTDTVKENQNWLRFEGKGVIKSAYCGYDIDGNEESSMGCVKISFDQLKVKFEHEEDYLKEPYVYQKAINVFSFSTVKPVLVP